MSKIMYMDNEYAGFSLTTDFDTPVTVTFPFTATSGGVLSATVVPSTSSTSYIYVVDNLSTSYRFASSGGLSYQMTIPIVKGRTYSISASSNYAINGTIKFYPFKSTPSSEGAHTDAYIERTYNIGTATTYYHNDTVDIAVDGYTPISMTAQSNQASVHFYNLSFTNTTATVGRAQWNSSTPLSSNTVTLVVRYIKTSLLGG